MAINAFRTSTGIFSSGIHILFSYLDYIGFGAEDDVPCGAFVGAKTDAALVMALNIFSERERCRSELKKRLPERKMLAQREFSEILSLLESI